MALTEFSIRFLVRLQRNGFGWFKKGQNWNGNFRVKRERFFERKWTNVDGGS